MNENNRSMFKKRAAAVAVASCLTLLPWVAEAAGLGKLTVLSGLGQPLRAEMEISAHRDELVGMTARLAPAEIFSQAGVEYASTLRDLRFSIEKRSGGRSVVKVSSHRPINEPFLDFLVELSWPTGRTVREYTFLLDPPEMAQAQRSVVDARVVETVRGGGAEPEVKAPAKPATAPSGAPAASPSPRPQQKPEAQPRSEGTTRRVETGDNLRRIATETKYEGVTLEQMLVGLYRSNREAFIDGDINRLKAGAILNLPDKASVESVSPREARSVYVPTSDFAGYRRKLAAAAVAEAPREAAPATQESAGKIKPKVDEKTPTVDPARDQVKVARAEGAGKSAAETAAEADRVARDKALKEAQDRLAQLEKNVGELQRLLEMKNQRLAELERQPVAPTPAPAPVVEAAKPVPASPVTPPVPPVVAPPAEPAKPEVSAEKPAEPAAPPANPVQQALEKPTEAPAPKPVPTPVEVPPPAPEPGFVDMLAENPIILAGGAGLLALLGGWVAYRRRRVDTAPAETTALPNPSSLGPNSVFRMTGGQSVDTSAETPPQTGEFSQAGPGTIDTDEVDPVAEADVYMAYGRDAQAEEILIEAMQKDPQRLAIHAKLAEIYANRRSVKQFETLASELYAQTAGVGPEWEKVAALGADLDPANPLYGSAKRVGGNERFGAFDADATMIVTPAAAAAARAAAVDAPVEVVAAVEPVEAVEAQLEADATGQHFDTLVLDEAPGVPEAAAPAPEMAAAVDDAGALDFDLGSPADEPVSEAAKPADEPYVDTFVTGESVDPVQVQSQIPAPPAMQEDALDFDLSGMVGGDETAAPAVAVTPPVEPAKDEISLDSLDFDLPASSVGSLAEISVDAPDFSPEGTLVMPSGLSDSALSGIELEVDAPADLAFAAQADAQGTATVVNPMAARDSELATDLEDNPDLTSTVVNPDQGEEKLADDDVDFDVKLSDSVFLGQPMMAPEFDIGSINLDLAAEPAVSSPVAVAPFEDAQAATEPEALPDALGSAVAEPEIEHDALWEEVNTKLDLAKAYEEMGDQEGARELLQEVLAEGTPDLVAQAQEVLGRIGG